MNEKDLEQDVQNDLEDFQYDNEGNVVIPDDAEDEVTKEAEEKGEEPKADNTKEPEPKDEKKDESQDRIAELERKLAEANEKNEKQAKQGKDILKKLGFEGDTFEDALNKAGAEADDTSVEEFIQKQKEAATQEEAKQLLLKTKYEGLKKADLEELKRVFPDVEEVKNLDDVEKMGNFKRFGELRDLGLSVEEAYRAANPRAIERKVAQATKQSSLNNTKNHLKSNVPKGTKDTSVRMTSEELETFRDIFPEKSDAELLALYKQSN